MPLVYYDFPGASFIENVPLVRIGIKTEPVGLLLIIIGVLIGGGPKIGIAIPGGIRISGPVGGVIILLGALRILGIL